MRRFAMIKLLLEMLRKNPMAGADLGDGIRKVRMAITSKGKGKSGGARVIILLQTLLLSIVKENYYCPFTTSLSIVPYQTKK